MLGRLVDQYVITDPAASPVTLWGDVLPVMQRAALRLANLECVISTKGRPWRPGTKPFHFRAHPRAVEFLHAAQIDCVNLANNHVLDYGVEALLECLALLDRAGIRRAGAGRHLAEALAPAVLSSSVGPVAVIGLTDNEPEWEATGSKAGVNFLRYTKWGLVEPYRSGIAGAVAQAKRRAPFLIVSAHVGPNWGLPSAAMQALAHELIDLGADVYWGHSNHVPQAIEHYKGKVILYSTGDFVDDYAVDERERNDLSFLFLLDLHQYRVRRVSLHPVAIEGFRARTAKRDEASFLMTSMRSKCAAFGSRLEVQDDVGIVRVA